MNTPQEVLNAAREIIERDGWHQGNYCDGVVVGWGIHVEEEYADHGLRTAPVCAMGAINRATSGWANKAMGPHYFYAVERLVKVIGSTTVAHWNDAPERTVEDVLLAFKRAAEDD